MKGTIIKPSHICKKSLTHLVKIFSNSTYRHLKTYMFSTLSTTKSCSLNSSTTLEEQREFVEQKEPLLNPKQRKVYDFVCDCLNRDIAALIFIDAPGGTGRTFLNNLILAKVRSSGDIALAVASSGIAATLMPGGRIAHSRFKIPLTVKDNDLCNFDRSSNTANLLRNTKIIVWDECPMMRRESFEAVD